MPALWPENTNLKPTSGPPMVGMILIVLTGLLIVFAGLEFHWRGAPPPTPQDKLALAEKAAHYGDDHMAATMFGRLAKGGNATAQYWLAHMTELGLGTPRNPTRAIGFYKKAAKQNFIDAEVRLGEIYLDGNLVPPDPKRAKQYLDDAAYGGNAHAATLLGQIYRDGIGVTANSTRADAWFEVANLEGSKIARKERGSSFRKLSMADQHGVISRTQDILKTIKKKAPQMVNNTKRNENTTSKS